MTQKVVIYAREQGGDLDNWQKALDAAKQEDAFVMFTMGAFIDEPEVLRVALLMARERGVTVIVVPSEQEIRDHEFFTPRVSGDE